MKAAFSSAIEWTVSALAPIALAWASKSTAKGSTARLQSLIRLLKEALPVLFCSLLMTAKPPLSQTTTISFRPVRTEE